MRIRWIFLPLIAFLEVGVVATPTATACPFCSAQGQTLSGEISQADFIVLGTLANPKRDPNDFTKGTTELLIETVVKPHDYLIGKKFITIPRYIPIDPKAVDSKLLVFSNLYTRAVDTAAAGVLSPLVIANNDAVQLDAYRGEPVRADSKLAEYLKGAIEVRQKDSIARLRYFFEYLDSNDLVISTDAMNEFGYADYKEVRQLAEKLPAAKVLRWIQDPSTPQSRLGLYGLFIGHCGKKEDAAAIRKLLDAPDNAFASGLDGILASYVMLDAKAGWDYSMKVLNDPKSDFQVRYAVLKVLRFYWEFRPDLIKHEQVLEGMKFIVALPEMADLPIEDLRKWGCWELTDFVLKFADEKSHNGIPITRRAILRFALAAPVEQKAAKVYVERIRKEDPERVKYVEQTLLDEIKPSKPPETKPTNGK